MQRVGARRAVHNHETALTRRLRLTRPLAVSSDAERHAPSAARTDCPEQARDQDRGSRRRSRHVDSHGRSPSSSGPRKRGSAYLTLLTGGGTDGNEQLTALAGAMLIVLLAIIGVTIVRKSQLISVHLFVGLVLIGPVALKMASTGYRFVRYYTRNGAYQRKGTAAAGAAANRARGSDFNGRRLRQRDCAAVRRPHQSRLMGADSQGQLHRVADVHRIACARASAGPSCVTASGPPATRRAHGQDRRKRWALDRPRRRVRRWAGARRGADPTLRILDRARRLLPPSLGLPRTSQP